MCVCARGSSGDAEGCSRVLLGTRLQGASLADAVQTDVGRDGHAGAQIDGVQGEVQLACQFFSKGDRVKLLDQVVPEDEDEAELDNLEEQYQARRRREDEVQEERRRRWAVEDEARKRQELEAAAAAREREREREREQQAEAAEAERRRQCESSSNAGGLVAESAVADDGAGQVASRELALMTTHSGQQDEAHDEPHEEAHDEAQGPLASAHEGAAAAAAAAAASAAVSAPGLVNAMPAAEGPVEVQEQAPPGAQSAADDASPPTRGCCC